jgi:hypothetical protein
MGHMTIVRENIHELPLFIRKFREFGFDGVDFGYDASVPKMLRFQPLRKRRLRREVQQALAECDDRSEVNDLRLRLLGLVK